MDALTEIKTMVDRIVGEVLESRLAEIRHEVLHRVEGELQPLLVQQDGAAALLNVTVNAIQASASQADILRGVLDGATNFAGRSALFVVRSDVASPWHARGMDEAALRGKSINIEKGAGARAVKSRQPQEVSSDDRPAGISPVGDALILPLLVREKVAALLYVDAGDQGRSIDRHALELLLRSSGLWLEVVARRRGSKTGAVEAESERAPRSRKEGASAGASGNVAEGMVAPPERVQHTAVPAEDARRPEPPIIPAERVAESAASLVSEQMSAEPAEAVDDEEVHTRARRFARLLVDEIKLYNEEKVTEGRAQRDLYERLKDDIDKSRAAYDRRYGNTAAASADYFQQELVRILADNDAESLGAGQAG